VPEVAQRSVDTSAADLSAIQPEQQPDDSRKNRGDLEVAGRANDGIGRIEIPSGSEGNIKITDEAGTQVNVTPTGGSASDVGSSGGSSSSDGDSSSGGSSDSGSSSGGSSGGGGSSSGTDSGSGTTTPASTNKVTLSFDPNKLQAWIIEEGSSSRTLTTKTFNVGDTVKIGANKRDHHEAPILSLTGDLAFTTTDGQDFTALYTFTMPASDVTATLTSAEEEKYSVSVQYADGCTFAKDTENNDLMPSIKSGCETSYYNNDHVSILIENLPTGVINNQDQIYLYRDTVSDGNFYGNATYAHDDSSGEDEISFQMTDSNIIIYFAPAPATP